jgi:hypothetical protein
MLGTSWWTHASYVSYIARVDRPLNAGGGARYVRYIVMNGLSGQQDSAERRGPSMSGSSVVARRAVRVAEGPPLGWVEGLSMSGSSVLAEFRRGILDRRSGLSGYRRWGRDGAKYVPNIVSKHTELGWEPSTDADRSRLGNREVWEIDPGVSEQKSGGGSARKAPGVA